MVSVRSKSGAEAAAVQTLRDQRTRPFQFNPAHIAVSVNIGTFCLPLEKRRRAAAVQDAGARFYDQRKREASWSAPALWSFGTGKPACANVNMNCYNLRQIDAAINEWALENKKTNGTPVTENDITGYIKLNSAGKVPGCPKGGTYTLRKVGDVPQVTCSRSTATPGDFLP